MAKLKYDRPLNIPFTKGTQVTVPKDEVWKLTAETDIAGGVHGISTNLYGGGTNSTAGDTDPLPEMYSPASPSSTSTSKQLHGGGAPWLRDLFSIDRWQFLQRLMMSLLCRMVKFGKQLFATMAPSERRMSSSIVILEQILRTNYIILLWARVQKFGASITRLSPVSLLKSWRNNVVEGVALYG